MNGDPAWLDNSGAGNLQFDFHPPANWTSERVAAEQAAIAALLDGSNGADGGAAVPGWLQLARRLPASLRGALVAELRAGNRLAGIGSSGWPAEGSIVVSMGERFTAARQALPEGVAWRVLDDPHYAREELSQRVGTIEHLLIT